MVGELKEIHKPFVVLLNTLNPTSPETMQLAAEMESRYAVPVCPVNCLEMEEAEIRRILEKVLFEFPVREIAVELPKWVTGLDKNNPIRRPESRKNMTRSKTRWMRWRPPAMASLCRRWRR